MNRYLTCCQTPFDINAVFSIEWRSAFLPSSIHYRASIIALLSYVTIGLSPLPAQSQSANSSTAPQSAPQSGTQSTSQSAPEAARPILKLGSQGGAVTELQAVLKLLGYFTGAIDGSYQESTATAVSTFQQAAGLQPDGIVGAETWNRLLPIAPPVSATTATMPAMTPSNPTASSSPVTPGTVPSRVTATPVPAARTTIPTSGPTSNPTADPPSQVSPAPTPTVPPTSFPSPTSSNPTPTSSNPTPTPSRPQSVTPAPATPIPTNPAPTGYTPLTPTPSTPSTAASAELPVLKIGTQGEAVTRLQERLKAIGVFTGSVDGVFGEETQIAVQEAQRRYSLEPDGVVGAATWAALLKGT